MSQINEQLKSVDLDVATYEDYLLEVSKLVRDQKVSQYPIFVVHQEAQVILGKPLIDAAKAKTKWSVNISHLEDFVNKEVITKENVETFRANFKPADQFMCLFLLSPENAKFIFRPFTIKS